MVKSARAARNAASTKATKSNWPASTPRLNVKSAIGISVCGSPISFNAPAKPKPCNKPNVNETTHGYCSESRGSPFRSLISSLATKAMLAFAAG
jgi:hypothetical protein